MDNHERFQSPDQQGNADVCLAKEQRIATLSSLVCELMRENQELRQVLSETGLGGITRTGFHENGRSKAKEE